MKLANTSEQDMDTALHIGGILNDLDDYNRPFGTASIRTLESIDNPDAEEEPENDLADFDATDARHCRLFVQRLLKLLDRSPGCLNRVLWGFSTARSNDVFDKDSDHLKLHPRLEAALHCQSIYYKLAPLVIETISHLRGSTNEGSDAWHLAESLSKCLNEDPAAPDPQIDLQNRAKDALAWFIQQCLGDSGTGESHWEQFPEYRAAQATLAALQAA